MVCVAKNNLGVNVIKEFVKMNSKTNLVKTAQEDPYSPQLYGLDTVLAMRDAGVNIVGLGYTIYLGSEYEATMLAEAGDLIAQAHAEGLLVVLWIYPRGKAVTAEKDPDLIAGAAGVALCLGADFVKVFPADFVLATLSEDRCVLRT